MQLPPGWRGPARGTGIVCAQAGFYYSIRQGGKEGMRVAGTFVNLFRKVSRGCPAAAFALPALALFSPWSSLAAPAPDSETFSPDPLYAMLAEDARRVAENRVMAEQIASRILSEEAGFTGVRLSDLAAGRAAEARRVPSCRLTEYLPEASLRASSGDAPAKESPEFGQFKEADSSLSRESDGGLVFIDNGWVNLVGFYGYGGVTRGKGFQFTGTGYTGAEGTSRVIPSALALAGITSDPQQVVYSAEMRAEAPIEVERGVEFVPFAGIRAVRTDEAGAGVASTLASETSSGASRRNFQQVPVGLQLRLSHDPDPRTRVQLHSTLSAIGNSGDAGDAGPDGPESVSLIGVGSVGLGVERGDWYFSVGADAGVSNRNQQEEGISVNVRHKF